jgi:hypothetical protein
MIMFIKWYWIKHTILAINACDVSPLDEPDGEWCCDGFVYKKGREEDNSHTSDTGNMSLSLFSDVGNTISLSSTGVSSSRPCAMEHNLLCAVLSAVKI